MLCILRQFHTGPGRAKTSYLRGGNGPLEFYVTLMNFRKIAPFSGQKSGLNKFLPPKQVNMSPPFQPPMMASPVMRPAPGASNLVKKEPAGASSAANAGAVSVNREDWNRRLLQVGKGTHS